MIEKGLANKSCAQGMRIKSPMKLPLKILNVLNSQSNTVCVEALGVCEVARINTEININQIFPSCFHIIFVPSEV